jgi:hypothetical protein
MIAVRKALEIEREQFCDAGWQAVEWDARDDFQAFVHTFERLMNSS